jgi:hypothetical protein
VSEASPEDRLEQLAPVTDDAPLTLPEIPLEAPDADVAEQASEVDLDEDDRR